MVDREGILKLYTLENIAEPGEMPVEKLKPIGQAYYRKRTVGYGRFYAALGANQQIDMIVRIYNTFPPEYGVRWFVSFDDGEQFRVDAVQEIVDEGCLDLTLVRLEDFYDVLAE